MRLTFRKLRDHIKAILKLVYASGKYFTLQVPPRGVFKAFWRVKRQLGEINIYMECKWGLNEQ